jgi:hypothetical protein
MKNKIILCLSLILIFSCENNYKKVKEDKKNNNIQAITNKINLVGTWKIDSIFEGESKIFFDNQNGETSQGFEFNYQKKLCVTKGESPKISKQIGFYSQDNDSLFFENMNKEIFQRYHVRVLSDKLILEGNFFISEENKKRPTFYLSRD